MKPEALPDDLRDLLQAEKDAPPPPDAVKARVRARVESSLVATGAGLKLVLALVAVSTVAGGLWLGTREPEHVAAEPEAIPAIVKEEEPRRVVAAEPVQTLPPPKRLVTPRPGLDSRPTPALIKQAPGPLPKTLLAEERALLDASRASLQRKDAIAARVALRKHEREFEHGQLEEEREVLWILVLGLEKDPTTETRAAAFKTRYPASLFVRTVDDAVRRLSAP